MKGGGAQFPGIVCLVFDDDFHAINVIGFRFRRRANVSNSQRRSTQMYPFWYFGDNRKRTCRVRFISEPLYRSAVKNDFYFRKIDDYLFCMISPFDLRVSWRRLCAYTYTEPTGTNGLIPIHIWPDWTIRHDISYIVPRRQWRISTIVHDLLWTPLDSYCLIRHPVNV